MCYVSLSGMQIVSRFPLLYFQNSVNANQRSFVYTKEQGSIMFDKLQITGNATSVVTAAESGQKDV